jgi:NAD(P)-dependent dehydrogenase (short-subunit alcohol dehydrogenase family)
VISAIPVTIPRAALITGGETEIGLALAHALADAGFATALQCHAPPPGDPPTGTEILRADLSVETRVAALIPRAEARIGTIGVLINAAGIATPDTRPDAGPDTWEEPTRATWDARFETNLRAPFVLIRHFAHALVEPHEGVVINLFDQRLDPRALSRTLANAALWTLTQTMALALAPRIRVNGIASIRYRHGPAPGHDGRATSVPAPRQGAESGPATTRSTASREALVRAAIAILALPSMTGQMMGPDGVPGRAARQGASTPSDD